MAIKTNEEFKALGEEVRKSIEFCMREPSYGLNIKKFDKDCKPLKSNIFIDDNKNIYITFGTLISMLGSYREHVTGKHLIPKESTKEIGRGLTEIGLCITKTTSSGKVYVADHYFHSQITFVKINCPEIVPDECFNKLFESIEEPNEETMSEESAEEYVSEEADSTLDNDEIEEGVTPLADIIKRDESIKPEYSNTKYDEQNTNIKSNDKNMHVNALIDNIDHVRPNIDKFIAEIDKESKKLIDSVQMITSDAPSITANADCSGDIVFNNFSKEMITKLVHSAIEQFGSDIISSDQVSLSTALKTLANYKFDSYIKYQTTADECFKFFNKLKDIVNEDDLYLMLAEPVKCMSDDYKAKLLDYAFSSSNDMDIVNNHGFNSGNMFRVQLFTGLTEADAKNEVNRWLSEHHEYIIIESKWDNLYYDGNIHAYVTRVMIMYMLDTTL